MAVAVVCANSLLIRGSRDRQQPRRPLIPDGAALGDWQLADLAGQLIPSPWTHSHGPYQWISGRIKCRTTALHHIRAPIGSAP